MPTYVSQNVEFEIEMIILQKLKSHCFFFFINIFFFKGLDRPVCC